MKYFVILGSVCALALLVSCAGVTQVDTGKRGVKTSFGKVIDGPLTEGLYFYNPFSNDIVELDVKAQIMEGETTAYTKDVQQTTIKYIFNYNLKTDAVVSTYQSVGLDWSDKIVSPVVEANIKEILGQFEAVDLITNREKAKVAIVEQIKRELENRGVNTINFELSNIDFADEFEKAVEAKVTAIQRAAEAKNKTVQVQEEANQKIIEAKAQAEAMRIQSQALASNQGLIDYEAVRKWNGVLPTYMLGGATPFVNLPTKDTK